MVADTDLADIPSILPLLPCHGSLLGNISLTPQVTVLESPSPLVTRKPYVPSEPVGTPPWLHACTLGECTQPGELCTLAFCTIRGYLENSFIWLHVAYSLLSGPTGDSGAWGTHPDLGVRRPGLRLTVRPRAWHKPFQPLVSSSASK